jgi:hypothetical protein
MRVSVPLRQGEALVLYECLKRYHESESPDLVTDRAEWRVLINVLGELERRLSDPRLDYRKSLERAKRDLDNSDAPF